MSKLNNFHYAISLAQTLYDIEGDDDDLEEIGLVAYNFIGNKNTRLYRASLDINCQDGSVQLPCNVDIIEAVTYCGPEDWGYTSNTKEFGDIQSLYTENYIESRKAFLDPFYVSGKFVKYKRVGDTLYVNKGLGRINILYHGILLDEEGLPEINEKEKEAIACYCAVTKRFKEGWKNHNQNMLQEAQLLEQRWLKLCDAARVSIYINQNEMNTILDAKTSWNRKIFNKSYKPMK